MEERWRGKVGRSMENNNPAADDGGWRYGVELGIQIAAMYNDQLDSMEETLLQAIRDICGYIGPANITSAPAVMLIYTLIKNARHKLISKIGRQDVGFEIARQDVGPMFQLAYALISIALGCIACSLLIYVLLGDMPWLIIIPYVLMLIFSFEFERGD